MKNSYKIALLAAAGILLVVIIYFAAQGNREAQPRLAEAGSSHDAGEATTANAKDDEGLASNDASSSTPWTNRHRTAPATVAANRSSAASSTGFQAQATTTPHPGNETEQASDRADFLAGLKATAAAVRGEETTAAHVPTSGSQAQSAALSANRLAAAAGSRNLATNEDTQALVRANQTLSVNGNLATKSVNTGTRENNVHPTANTSAPNPDPSATTSADASPFQGSRQTSVTSQTPGTYTIKEGDTFTSIARHRYHDEHRWVDIAQANPLVDPTRLHIGQKIRLPGPERRASRSAAITPSPPTHASPTSPRTRQSGATNRGKIYTVQAGDTLWTIARQHYDDPTQWRTIFEANRRTLGNDPNHIDAGQALVIPFMDASRTR